MVAAGMGVTLVPRSSVPKDALTTKPNARKAKKPMCGFYPSSTTAAAAAQASRGVGVASQFYPLRSDCRFAQCGLRLRVTWLDAFVLSLWNRAGAFI
jgi:hypothetical protein